MRRFGSNVLSGFYGLVENSNIYLILRFLYNSQNRTLNCPHASLTYPRIKWRNAVYLIQIKLKNMKEIDDYAWSPILIS